MAVISWEKVFEKPSTEYWTLTKKTSNYKDVKRPLVVTSSQPISNAPIKKIIIKGLFTRSLVDQRLY